MEGRPYGLAPIGFHLRHMARSLDRLLTYAEGQQLSDEQLAALARELAPAPGAMAEFRAGIERAVERVKAIAPETFEDAREVGRQRLPTTVGGLLVHCAEHTQRHAGQAVTTAKVVVGMRAMGPLIAHAR
jgi:hypothetical protein